MGQGIGLNGILVGGRPSEKAQALGGWRLTKRENVWRNSACGTKDMPAAGQVGSVPEVNGNDSYTVSYLYL